MSPELHQRVRKLFDEALDHPESERLEFLKSACAGDDEAFQATARLLAAHQPAQSLLENSPRTLDRIGRYVITGELGRGGMGVVYQGMDPLIGRRVAIKVIHTGTLGGREEALFLRDRLFREARSAGQLFHPGIVTVLDVGQEGELAFIAMELVDGQSLHSLLASGRKLELPQSIQVLRQTAAALDFAHHNDIIHRDVKPANILIDVHGNAKLTDFGIAKITSTQYHTRTGLVLGTPSYMSPEQIEGHALDGRSDQFSLAVVAFELLTGKAPFPGDSLAGIAHAIVYGPRPSACARDPRLEASVDGVLQRALSSKVDDRFPNCSEFVRELETALHEPPKPPAIPEPPPVPRAARPRSRAKVWIAAAGALSVVLAAASAYHFGLIPPGLISRSNTRPTAAPPAPAQQAEPAKPAEVQQPPPSAPAPEIVEFEALPATVKPGGTAILRWNVQNAAGVSISPDVGSVAVSGSAQVRLRTATTFTLSANGPGGAVTKEVQVALEQSGPTIASLEKQAASERNAGHAEKAFALLLQAADLGDANAMVELGNMCADGVGTPKSDSEAMRWFTKAADRGNVQSMLQLGSMYYLGTGIAKDFGRAAYWFQKATDAGSASAKYDLGEMYESGLGVPRDLNRAKKLYQEAAAAGEEEAKRRLAVLGAGK